MSFLEQLGNAIWHSILALFRGLVHLKIKTGWRHLTSHEFMVKHEYISYFLDSQVRDYWDDLVEYGICPWYHPLASLTQVLTPLLIFLWEIFGKSPVFWLLFITLIARWVYHSYYRYLAVGRGGTPSTFGGWWRTKYLLFYCRVLLRVNVLSSPFLDPMTEPYRGMLFDLDPREGERPTVLGLAPQRQGNQKASPDTEAAMVAILERKAAENPGALVIGPSLVEGHLRALKRRLPAGLAPATPMTVAEWGGEISHVRRLDSSAHVIMHPADCAEVIQKGWGERHPLGCAAENPVWRFWHHTICRKRLPLPHNIVLVYAPRTDAELAMFGRIVDAAAWFAMLPAAPALVENGTAPAPFENAPTAPFVEDAPAPAENA